MRTRNIETAARAVTTSMSMFDVAVICDLACLSGSGLSTFKRGSNAHVGRRASNPHRALQHARTRAQHRQRRVALPRCFDLLRDVEQLRSSPCVRNTRAQLVEQRDYVV